MAQFWLMASSATTPCYLLERVHKTQAENRTSATLLNLSELPTDYAQLEQRFPGLCYRIKQNGITTNYALITSHAKIPGSDHLREWLRQRCDLVLRKGQFCWAWWYTCGRASWEGMQTGTQLHPPVSQWHLQRKVPYTECPSSSRHDFSKRQRYVHNWGCITRSEYRGCGPRDSTIIWFG